MGQQYVNAYRYKVRRAEAAFTCSEDETVAQVLSLSQVPPSASSSTSLTATSGLHTPWSHSLSCWLPLLVDAGAGSCRKGMGGSTAGVVDAGLLLLVEMGQSMPLSFSGGNQTCAPHTERVLLYMEHSLERPSGEQPHLSPHRPNRPGCNTGGAVSRPRCGAA